MAEMENDKFPGRERQFSLEQVHYTRRAIALRGFMLGLFHSCHAFKSFATTAQYVVTENNGRVFFYPSRELLFAHVPDRKECLGVHYELINKVLIQEKRIGEIKFGSGLISLLARLSHNYVYIKMGDTVEADVEFLLLTLTFFYSMPLIINFTPNFFQFLVRFVVQLNATASPSSSSLLSFIPCAAHTRIS